VRIGLEPLLNDERVGGPGATWMGLQKYFERAGHEVVAGVEADAYMLLMGYDLGARLGQGRTVLLRTTGCGIAEALEQGAQDGLLSKTLSWADVVVGVGPWARKQIRQMLGIDIGSRMVLEGADHEVFHPAERVRKPSRPRLITACADWDDWPGRRLHSHLEVARILGWPLHVIGRIETAPEGYDMITCRGSKRHGEMADLYRSNPGIFLMAQWTHAWPHVVAEAMMSGLPIVYSDVGGTAYMVGPGGVGVPDPQIWDFKRIEDYDDPDAYWDADVEGLADACRHVWEEWETYAQLAYYRTLGRLTWENAAQQYLKYLGAA